MFDGEPKVLQARTKQNFIDCVVRAWQLKNLKPLGSEIIRASTGNLLVPRKEASERAAKLLQELPVADITIEKAN